MISVRRKEPTRAEWNDSEMRVEVKRGVKEHDEDTEEKKKVRLPLFLRRCGWETVVVLRLQLSRGNTLGC